MKPPTPAQPNDVAERAAALRQKVLLIHHRLCDAYGCPVRYFHDLDPLSELVSSLLSHRTKNADSGRAFRSLRERFANWESVRDAPTPDVEEAIAAATWPEQKAPRIRQVLRDITDRRGGTLSLDFLKDMAVPAARAWLEELPGVGPKTSAAVLAFSTLRMAALPVDCHHHRVAQRLGVIGRTVDVGPAHPILAAQLPPDFTPQQVYDHNEVMMFHGQRCCFHAAPACERCVLLDLCPHGQRRLGRVPSAESASGPLPPPPGKDAAHHSEGEVDLFGQQLGRTGAKCRQ